MPLFTTNDFAEASHLLGGGPHTAVAIPVHNSPDDVARCLASVLAHTPVEHPVLVIDDASTDPTAVDAVLALDDSVAHRVVLFRHEMNTGFVGSCNDAFAICAGRDVVLVNSDVEVAAGWLVRMNAAAQSSNTVATVSTLTNHGTIVSVPTRNTPGPMPAGLSVDVAAQRVAEAARRSYPVLPTGIGHCLLVTRAALDTLGGFDEVFAPGYGEEVDFCQRAASRGFINVLADDVFVFHRGGSSFGTSPAKLAMQADHERMVNERHPNYAASVQWAAASRRSPLAASLGTARRALVGTRIAVDGLCLREHLMGTQRFVIETAIALAERPDVAETHLFVPLDVPDYVRRATDGHPRLVVHPLEGWVEYPDHYDAVVRPYQVDHVSHLHWMRSLADVAVVTQLDLIAYHNPAYFKDAALWKRYRDITELTFEVVDGVAFISEHSQGEAVREGLLTTSQQRAITYCGVDHRSAMEPGVPPDSPVALRDGFVLVLGAGYLHKNRPFALELWGLLRGHGFTGQLVMAGVAPPFGNSLVEEQAWQTQHPDLADDVITLGPSSESEKAWLLQHAGLVLYPTLSEGFGMVPFEAAAAGTPVITTRQGALAEVLPAELACAPTLLAPDSLELALRLLDDEAYRAQHVALLQASAERFTWSASAAALADLVSRTLLAPTRGRSDASLAGAGSLGRWLDRSVRAVRANPVLHRIVSGSGTRRQRVLRRVANWMRRRAT